STEGGIAREETLVTLAGDLPTKKSIDGMHRNVRKLMWWVEEGEDSVRSRLRTLEEKVSAGGVEGSTASPMTDMPMLVGIAYVVARTRAEVMTRDITHDTMRNELMIDMCVPGSSLRPDSNPVTTEWSEAASTKQMRAQTTTLIGWEWGIVDEVTGDEGWKMSRGYAIEGYIDPYGRITPGVLWQYIDREHLTVSEMDRAVGGWPRGGAKSVVAAITVGRNGQEYASVSPYADSAGGQEIIHLGHRDASGSEETTTHLRVPGPECTAAEVAEMIKQDVASTSGITWRVVVGARNGEPPDAQ
ncbi:MAG: hypothetical protein LBR78_01835, partial [Holosporales bacterium]|nr:hypothetical protein [Holosporales bacterium]